MVALPRPLRHGFWRKVWAIALVGAAPAFAAGPPPDAKPPEGSPVAAHGKLSTRGNTLLDEHGNPVQLRGMSFFWECWMGKYWNKDVVAWLSQDWKVSLVRLAMGVDPAGGYLDKPEEQKGILQDVVNAAIEAGIYVIVDWHTEKANTQLDDATAFFDEMARIYGSYPNVLFETFNEPTTQDWSKDVKPYHEKIVSTIRKHTDSVVILGTTTWSQDVDIASQDPVEGENLAYTIHFYAASHKQALRDKAIKALARNVTLFSTEWGTCDYTGNGTLDLNETRTWMDFFAEHHISLANWAISDKFEACSSLMPGASSTGGWSVHNLTQSGYFMRNWLRDEDAGVPCFTPGWPCVKETSCAGSDAGCKDEKCCSVDGQSCFEKDSGWAQCMETCVEGIHDTDPPKYQAPWSCKVLGAKPSDSEGKQRTASEPLLKKEYKWVSIWAGVSTVWATLATIGFFVVKCGGSGAYGSLPG